jgi:hypothetical protein
MAHALPCSVRHLFLLLQDLGLPQVECARHLGVTPQAVNNWASGRNSLPLRYRAPAFRLVAAQLSEALLRAAPHPEARTTCKQQASQNLFRWYFELQEARGVSDTWYDTLGKRLAIGFKTPLSTHGAVAWRDALQLHLEAANMLRRLLRLHDPAPGELHPLETTAMDDPVAWFWGMVEAFELLTR